VSPRTWQYLVIPVAFASAAWGQGKPPLGNEDVVKLLRAGFREVVLLEAIEANEGRFDTSPKALLALKAAGISETVMSAMLSKAQARETADLERLEPGVYARTKDGYMPLEPEVLSCCAYLGGNVELVVEALGAHSRSVVSAPAEFLIVCSPESANCDYQLLRAQQRAGTRAFILEASVQAGVVVGLQGFWEDNRGTLRRLPIERGNVSDRAFRIRPPHLPKGEYGFLPPARLNEKRVSPVGRIYTFRIQ